MSGIREPDLPAPYDAIVRELVHLTSEELASYGETPPGRGTVPWAPPQELMEMLATQVRRVCAIARAYKVGDAVRRGSEARPWQASTSRNAALIARYAGGDPHREQTARAALAAFDELQRSGQFGLVGLSREQYLRAALGGQR